MKRLIINRTVLLLGVFALIFIFNSCEKDDDGSSSPINVSKVFLEDATSDEPDREVTFARQGQLVRLEGSGFTGVGKVYVNGYDCFFNPALLTDKSMLVRISMDVPVFDASDDVRNTIRLEKNVSNKLVYNFDIRAAAPSITRISHTMPQAGDRITIYGSGLQEAASVTFPGNIVVTEDIVSDEDGKFVTVTVPAGVSVEGGALLVVGANGGAYSPACFNFRRGLLHNFDDVNNASWSNGEISDDLSDVIPANGNGPKSQGVYRSLNKTGKEMAASDAAVDIARYWINNGVWASIISASVMNPATAASECAVQMDIYYEGNWNSGDIRFVVADGFGASRYCMIYAPWAVGGQRVPVENPGGWFTVTLPFSLSSDFEGKTFADVLAAVASASYAQAGPWLENGPFDGVASEPVSINVYFDNIRIVPLTTPAYSDF
jgi:hypothetical protein